MAVGEGSREAWRWPGWITKQAGDGGRNKLVLTVNQPGWDKSGSRSLPTHRGQACPEAGQGLRPPSLPPSGSFQDPKHSLPVHHAQGEPTQRLFTAHTHPQADWTARALRGRAKAGIWGTCGQRTLSRSPAEWPTPREPPYGLVPRRAQQPPPPTFGELHLQGASSHSSGTGQKLSGPPQLSRGGLQPPSDQARVGRQPKSSGPLLGCQAGPGWLRKKPCSCLGGGAESSEAELWVLEQHLPRQTVSPTTGRTPPCTPLHTSKAAQ